MELALIALAGLAGGAVNAIAGGGSLITFPALCALGVPPLVANMTNAVAMCPGYLGATFAQRRELAGQGARAARVIPIGVAGGVAGALLLRATGETAFEIAVPFLLVLAAGLLALQGRLRTSRHTALGYLPITLAAIYAGYFGAGTGVIILAGLGLAFEDTLVRLNALKQTISAASNIVAGIVFVVGSTIDWRAAGALAAGSLAGGVLGGAIASRVSAKLLRIAVIAIALAVAAYYFARL